MIYIYHDDTVTLQQKHQNCENIQFNDSIVVSIPVGRAGDPGSIPRRGVFF